MRHSFRKYWYTCTTPVAEKLAAQGYKIKDKPRSRTSAHSGTKMVFCHPSVLWQATKELHQEKIAGRE